MVEVLIEERVGGRTSALYNLEAATAVWRSEFSESNSVNSSLK